MEVVLSLPILHLDFETRSELDVRKVGPHVYASHHSTEVIAMAWCVQHGDHYADDIGKWWLGNGMILHAPIKGEFIIAAHNSAFERYIWNITLKDHIGFKFQPIERFRCSSARAAMLGLPPSLDGLANALRLKTRKDKEGNRLMKKLAQPMQEYSSVNMFGESGTIFDNDVAKHRRNAEYCMIDVQVEMEADQAMGPMPESELQIWLLDQKINDRGILIDRELCESLIIVVDRLMKQRGESLGELTGGAVTSATQPQRIKQWLNSKGIETPDGLGADILEKLLADTLPDDDGLRIIRQVLEIRRDTAKSSTAKCARMLSRSSVDGRMRDNLRYHGAFTGRWSGTGAQIHNYPRGKFYIDPDEPTTLDEIVADSFIDGENTVEMFFGDPVDAAKSMLRGCLIAPPEKKLIVWDYGQVEARGLPWLADEGWKLEAFFEIDGNNSLPDVYERSFCKSFGGDPFNVEKWQRQLGKVCELALGYQGGPGAFVSMAKIYRVEIADYLNLLKSKFKRVAAEARAAYSKRGSKSDIPRDTWIAAEICKINWRREHPKTVALWWGLEEAAIKCVGTGKAQRFGKIRFQMQGKFLKMIMPSGHVISYFCPLISNVGWKPALTYLKYENGRLMRIQTYGGKLAQNATESVSRSAMVDGMRRMDAAGFKIVGTVHDEIIAEQYKREAEEKLINGKKLMEMNSVWSFGFPLVANGEIMNRYRK